MPLILNIETATDICSIALSHGDKVLNIKESTEPFSHSKEITILIKQCLNDVQKQLKDLDAVAVSKGPGSYTALRIGTSVAKGICYALDLPLIAVDTLQSIAWATKNKEEIEALYAPMIDARRKDVFTALFDASNNPVTQTQFKVIDESSYQDYFASEKLVIFSGNGAEKCKSILHSPYAKFSSVLCSAANMPYLSHQSFIKQDFEDLAYFTPDYHKAPNITTPKKRL